MPELPDRPDLGQLRRQARELQRRAAAGDAGASHQVRSAVHSVTLAAAQLAVARDHGFASWPRLKAEVERRRAAVNDAERDGAGAAPPPLLDSWRSLPAGQADLVRAQYADRAGLRPILEAVLAAAAGFGPATVEARRTLVSLVSPRRVFAPTAAGPTRTFMSRCAAAARTGWPWPSPAVPCGRSSRCPGTPHRCAGRCR